MDETLSERVNLGEVTFEKICSASFCLFVPAFTDLSNFTDMPAISTVKLQS